MMRLLDQSLFEIYFNLLGENGSCRAVFGVTAKAEVLWSRAMGVCWAEPDRVTFCAMAQ